MKFQVQCPGPLAESDWPVTSKDGTVHYRVEGWGWNARKTFVLVDARSNIVAEGRVRTRWPHHICDLFRTGELAAHIRTSVFRAIRSRFVGEVPGPDTLDLRGRFVQGQFYFSRCARTVALVSTARSDGDEGFSVEVKEHEDPALILAAAVAVRCLCGKAPGTRHIAAQRHRPARVALAAEHAAV